MDPSHLRRPYRTNNTLFFPSPWLKPWASVRQPSGVNSPRSLVHSIFLFSWMLIAFALHPNYTQYVDERLGS